MPLSAQQFSAILTMYQRPRNTTACTTGHYLCSTGEPWVRAFVHAAMTAYLLARAVIDVKGKGPMTTHIIDAVNANVDAEILLPPL